MSNIYSVKCTSRREALAGPTYHHVFPQSAARQPRQSGRVNQQSNRAQRNNRGHEKSMELSAALKQALKQDGYVPLGLLESQSVAELRDSKSRIIMGWNPRRRELKWDLECAKVKEDWETGIKPKLEVLTGKTCSEPSLVEFNEIPYKSGTYKPEVPEGGYMVIIMIREGPGVPLLSKGSHLPGASIDPCLPVELKNGESVVYDWRIARQEPAFVGPGALVVTLLYK